MKILILFFVSIFCFSLILIGGKSFRHSMLYTLAIGGAVNANFFHAGTYPIMAFGLPFGIDSVIYTLAVFCILFMYFENGKKEAMTITISTIFAIVFSAIIQLIADLSVKGIGDYACYQTFFSFIASAVATVVAVYFMIKIAELLSIKRVNEYLVVIICIVIATIINSLIFYGLNDLIFGGLGSDFLRKLFASIIGKCIALITSLLTYYLSKKRALLQ